MSEILPVPYFQQSDEGYCLPACARMVLSYLDMEQDEASLRQMLDTKRYGTIQWPGQMVIGYPKARHNKYRCPGYGRLLE